MDNTKEIVIFGAGKIGRSFIGQLFGCSGYHVVFIDVDPAIIAGLNEKRSYRVVIKGDIEHEIIVPNVSAISAFDRGKVIEAVSKAGILAVSVGKNVLERIVPAIAAGVEKRYAIAPTLPLDIILAENMRSAADFVRIHLLECLPSDFPLEAMVGLIETSIGKMVPIIPQAELDKDPLVVFAEAYNTLIVDEKGFKLPIPQIKGLAPKSNIKAWVDRKAFIHNLGHATAAYYGYKLNPDSVYLYEVLEDAEVLLFTRAVMLQSANILNAVYPDDFTISDLENHIDDLISRFRNKSLQDTVFRVGQDLVRKLGPDDRFMGAIHLAIQYHLDYNLILEAMSYGFSFRATDDTGKCLPTDKDFLSNLSTDFESTLIEILGYDKVVDHAIIDALLKLHMKSGILN
jgi:mannitol-1-phosphate 5-dehydrogenase